jgi:class III poly(R)-hydroxyalkanoic acid synthase PhaE subunit
LIHKTLLGHSGDLLPTSPLSDWTKNAMSENPSQASTSTPWNEQWLQAQRAYWDAWRTVLPGMAGDSKAGTAANPWTQALETWWKSVSGGLNGDSAAVYARMMEQGKVFFDLGQQMNELLRAVAESSAAGAQWQDVLKQRFDAMKASMSMHQSSEWADSVKRMGAFFEMPLDMWRRICSGSSMLPGDCLEAFHSQVIEGIGEKFHGDMDRFLSVPGVGYTRESQEQVQLLAKLTLEYQKAMQEYINAHAKLGADALDRLYRKIIAVTERGERITSLRQLYDLWVDASEEVYGSFAMSPAFQEVYAKMVNALMRVKQHARSMVDEVLGAFNMPTRREMNTILKRQQELRRELRALHKRMEDGTPPPRGRRNGSDNDAEEVSHLRGEVAALREQVGALQAALDRGQPKAAESANANSSAAVEPIRKPRRSPALRAVKTEAPKKAERAPRPKSTVSKSPSSWDIGSIVSDASVTPIDSPRHGNKR